MSHTLNWYETHAQAFAQATNSRPVHTLLHTHTQTHTPGTALDLGCGTGRDTKHLLNAGWTVHAVDPSPAMISQTRQHCQNTQGTLITHTSDAQTFFAEQPTARFNLIWAMASLLHVPQNRMEEVLSKMVKALAPQGQAIAFFKHPQQGDRTDVVRACGRRFSDLSPKGLTKLLQNTDIHTHKTVDMNIFTENAQDSQGHQQVWTGLHIVAKS